MAKSKIKLNIKERRRFNNLNWFITNKILWYGERNEEWLKEQVLEHHGEAFRKNHLYDARYCVIAGQDEFGYYLDTLFCVNTKDEARVTEKYTRYTHWMLLDLDTLQVVRKITQPNGPNFDNFAEKLTQDLEQKRYVVLKKKFKRIANKYFKRRV